MRRRGKLIAFSTLAAGIAVLLMAGIAGKDRILEEWRIRRLEHGSREEAFAAGRWLGERKCVRAARPLLGAMKRACEEWLGGIHDGAQVAALLVGPASITRQYVPEALPAGYEHLELLRAFHRIGAPATPDLLRALIEEEDALAMRLAANVLLRLHGHGSFGVWVHHRDYGTAEVLPLLERLRGDPSAGPETRRLAAAALARLQRVDLGGGDHAPRWPPGR